MNEMSTLTSKRRRRMRWMSLIVVALVANLAAAATPVAAASQTKTTAVSLAGGTAVDVSYDVTETCDGCVPDDFAQLVTGQSSASFAFGATVHTAVDRVDWSSAGTV